MRPRAYDRCVFSAVQIQSTHLHRKSPNCYLTMAQFPFADGNTQKLIYLHWENPFCLCFNSHSPPESSTSLTKIKKRMFNWKKDIVSLQPFHKMNSAQTKDISEQTFLAFHSYQIQWIQSDSISTRKTHDETKNKRRKIMVRVFCTDFQRTASMRWIATHEKSHCHSPFPIHVMFTARLIYLLSFAVVSHHALQFRQHSIRFFVPLPFFV